MFNPMSHNPYYTTPYNWSTGIGMQQNQMQHSFNTIATSLQNNNGVSNDATSNPLDNLPSNDSLLNSINNTNSEMHQQQQSSSSTSANKNNETSNKSKSSEHVGTSSNSSHRHSKQKHQTSSPVSSNATSDLNNSNTTPNTNNTSNTENAQINKSLNAFASNYGNGVTASNMDSMLRLSANFDMMNPIGSTTAADLYNQTSAGLQAAALQTWQYGYQQYPFATSAYHSNGMVDMSHFSGEYFGVKNCMFTLISLIG